ncbi:hypothetical protein NE237_001079 [Protea cynaroides]|uniref:non-specific serine/threonine protein kinase n=1 Tax=Protea cynaroides TaxID=273540 RepID=A0A9Q0QXS2_9MAGN|nr:hypothetical protein NE237_001079 [Protea cynaroides]
MFPTTCLCFLFFQFFASAASASTSSNDTLTTTGSINDGQIIVSTGNNYALGFFSPGNSSYRYVGIWFHKIPEITVVWVANRDNPLNDSSGVVSLALDGNLIISSSSDQRRPLWSTNVSVSDNTTVLKLLNSGNLVLYSGGGTSRTLWQSFDHPTNILLPKMKLRLDRRIGLNRVLTSWRSKDDPGRGIYSFGFDQRGSPQPFLDNGSTPVWRGGPWDGQRFSRSTQLAQSHIYSYAFVDTTDELYTVYDIYNSSIISPIVLDDSGALQWMTWVERNRRWIAFYSAPTDWCDYYGHCGVYASCRTDNTAECNCLPGFQPKSPTDWYLTEWSDGCVRKRPLGCDITGGGSGCIAWFGDLMDIRYFSDGGDDLYLRVDAAELAAQARKDKGFFHKKWEVIFTVCLVVGFLFFAVSACSLRKKRKDKNKRPLLDWRKRFEIIMGIDRDVLYLHEDSRLRIVHRDLKASNVLLNEEMIPKISDFGMARIFDGDQIQTNTKSGT